jgi:hypothetical protein
MIQLYDPRTTQSVSEVMPGRTTSSTLTQCRNIERRMQYIEKQPSSSAKSATCVVRMSHKIAHNANCVGSVAQIGVHRTARQSASQTMSLFHDIFEDETHRSKYKRHTNYPHLQPPVSFRTTIRSVGACRDRAGRQRRRRKR